MKFSDTSPNTRHVVYTCTRRPPPHVTPVDRSFVVEVYEMYMYSTAFTLAPKAVDIMKSQMNSAAVLYGTFLYDPFASSNNHEHSLACCHNLFPFL